MLRISPVSTYRYSLIIKPVYIIIQIHPQRREESTKLIYFHHRGCWWPRNAMSHTAHNNKILTRASGEEATYARSGKICLKNEYRKFNSNFSGANELKKNQPFK